jgi:rod shape-determining protein MreC
MLLNRYRNLMVLAAVIAAQLLLLAYQIKNDQDVRLIRVWSVSAVTPLARVLESGRGGMSGLFRDYVALWGVRDENTSLHKQLDRVLMENHQLRSDLEMATRAEALAMFQKSSPMKTVPARLFMNTTGANTTVYVDVGDNKGVRRNMAVITPSGIVGRVVSVFDAIALVRLATDPNFAAGVVSQKNHVHGIMKGQGNSIVIVDYVQNEQKVEEGEWFFTSGEDGAFPRGLPAGVVTVARNGLSRKEIFVTPSGFQNGIEEVLIVTEGAHMPIPDAPVLQPLVLQPPPLESSNSGMPAQTGPVATDADRILEQNRRIGAAQGHVFGEKGGGAPNFNAPLPRELPPAADEAAPKQP